MTKSELLEEIAGNDLLLEIGRKAIEDTLIEFRDARISQFLRGNGLVICEKDGTSSDIIRLGPEGALGIGLRAIGRHLAATKGAHDDAHV